MAPLVFLNILSSPMVCVITVILESWGDSMKIEVENKIISSLDFSDAETAWLITDAILVLQFLKKNNQIVLGGDILTKKLEYTYDSWYYNVSTNQNYEYAMECSIKFATEYISDYIDANGDTFYVIFVVKDQSDWEQSGDGTMS